MTSPRLRVALWTAFFAMTLAPAADAGVWDRLLRGAAKTADDVPLSAADDVAARLAKNDDLRDAALRRLGHTADDAADLRRLRGLLNGADPALVRSLDDLAPAERQAAMVLAEGGASLTRTVPDVGLRGGLLRRGGADLAAGLGVAGDDAARAAVKLDAGLRGGTVVVPSGVRAVTLEDFGTFLTGGPNRWKFWDEAVRPHWKQWAAGGAMAALLAAPDEWVDELGNLTEEGARRLIQYVGEPIAGAIRGVAGGTQDVADDITEAVGDAVSEGAAGATAAFGLILAACVGALVLLLVAVGPVRRFLVRLLRSSSNDRRST